MKSFRKEQRRKMMSENALIPFEVDQLPSVELATDTELQELTKGTDYLQRIQLVTKGKYVDTGKINPGRYGIPQPGGEDILDLGPEIDILPFVVRPKALDMRDRDAVIAVYDMSLDSFKEIKELAADSDSSCMWGPSFLIFERSTNQLYEFFMGNKSARQESGKLLPFLPLSRDKAEEKGEEPHGPIPCTLKVRYAQRANYGWHVPVITKCSEPFTNLPPIDVIRAEIEKFQEAKDNGIERVTDKEETSSSRAR
jgi:hypothetical protein